MNELFFNFWLFVRFYMCRYFLSYRKIRYYIIFLLVFWYKFFNYFFRRLVYINKMLEKENIFVWYYKFRKIINFLIW